MRVFRFTKLSMFMFTAIVLQVNAEPLTLADMYSTKGLGVQLSIPRVSGANQHTTPLPLKLDPGGTIWPIFQDIYPCAHWFCKKEYGGMIIVMIARLKEPDANDQPTNPDQTKARAISLLEAARTARERTILVTGENKISSLLPQTLEIVSFNGKFWAKVKSADNEGKANGLLFWQILNREHTLTISLSVDREMVPKNFSQPGLEKFMDDFVAHIQIKNE